MTLETGVAAATAPVRPAAASVGGRLRRGLGDRRGQLGGLEYSAAPGEVALVVARAVERRERDAVRGSRGMDEPAVPEIQAGVVDGLHAGLRPLGPEEDEVTTLELLARDTRLGALGHVVSAALVHGDRVLEVHLHYVEEEAGTVEAACLLWAIWRVPGRVLAGPDVGIADELECEARDLLLTLAERREGDALVVGEAVQHPLAAHRVGAPEHIGDLGAIDGLVRRDLVPVAVEGMVEAELQLPRGHDVREIGGRIGLPAVVGLPARRLEAREQGPVGRRIPLLEPADDRDLRLRGRHRVLRPEGAVLVEVHVAVTKRHLYDAVVAVVWSHVLHGDGLDILAVVAGGEHQGAREKLPGDGLLRLEKLAVVVEDLVARGAALGDRLDGVARPVRLGHVGVALGAGARRGDGRGRDRAQREGDDDEGSVRESGHDPVLLSAYRAAS